MQLFSHPIPVLPTFSMDPFLKLPVTIRFLCLLLLACLSGYVEAHWKTLNIVNKCPTPIWPGIAPNAGHPLPAKGGFALSPGHNRRLVVPWTWQGRVWARAGCHFDDSGTGSCLTGDCAGKLECNGAIGEPPATLAQFSFQPDGKPSYYDVSLVDGYNVPVTIRGGGGECLTAGCGTDINRRCPNELAVEREGKVVACKSGCLAFDLDRFCCRNEYATPATCSPSMYSRVFKEACPAAYSYAYDSPLRSLAARPLILLLRSVLSRSLRVFHGVMGLSFALPRLQAIIFFSGSCLRGNMCSFVCPQEVIDQLKLVWIFCSVAALYHKIYR